MKNQKFFLSFDIINDRIIKDRSFEKVFKLTVIIIIISQQKNYIGYLNFHIKTNLFLSLIIF
mgnify:CR=1